MAEHRGESVLFALPAAVPAARSVLHGRLSNKEAGAIKVKKKNSGKLYSVRKEKLIPSEYLKAKMAHLVLGTSYLCL